jgi:hypothetical protein
MHPADEGPVVTAAHDRPYEDEHLYDRGPYDDEDIDGGFEFDESIDDGLGFQAPAGGLAMYDEPVLGEQRDDEPSHGDHGLGRRVSGERVDRSAGPSDTLCDAVVETVAAVGRIPVTVAGGFVRFTVDSGTAYVRGMRATAGLLGRLRSSARRPRCCLRR